nr:immunoglobulin heavy chain junction region [Mus musculus]
CARYYGSSYEGFAYW